MGFHLAAAKILRNVFRRLEGNLWDPEFQRFGYKAAPMF